VTETEDTAKTEASAETASAKEQDPVETSGDKWWWVITIGILLWIGFVSVAVLVMLSRGH
jgi:heme/copper-type cytochrome/quinol oxidase subunit 2